MWRERKEKSVSQKKVHCSYVNKTLKCHITYQKKFIKFETEILYIVIPLINGKLKIRIQKQPVTKMNCL